MVYNKNVTKTKRGIKMNKIMGKINQIFLLMIMAFMAIMLVPSVQAKAATTGSDIVEEARNHMGKPYRWGAIGPDSFDCSGFTQYVYGKFGITIARRSQEQVYNGYAVSRDELQPGDLVFFDNTYKDANPTHVGIYAGNNVFIHASSGAGKVIEGNLNDSYSAEHYGTARRIIESSNDSELEKAVFDYEYYADRYSDVKAAYGYNYNSLYSHWKNYGIKEGRSCSAVLDLDYYLNSHPDLVSAFGSSNYQAAYSHFINQGINEGRQSSPVFDVDFYAGHPDLKGLSNLQLVKHFINSGMNEGRNASAEFDPKVYKERYSDLSSAFGTNYRSYYNHYLTKGRSEGRIGN